ncbi:hypothetical protein ACMA5I_00515 [Paracoccaceae bacterium GXU_MW_L88]
MIFSKGASWRTTLSNPIHYYWTGALLFWLFPFVYAADILLAPQWYAPHWQCDSLGIPIGGAIFGALPSIPFVLILSAILVFPATRARQIGADIFDLSLGRGPLKHVLNLIAVVVILAWIYSLFQTVWSATVPQTFTADCGGSAEPITVTMRGPIFEIFNLYFLVLIIWLLHLRAMALSPKITPRIRE